MKLQPEHAQRQSCQLGMRCCLRYVTLVAVASLLLLGHLLGGRYTSWGNSSSHKSSLELVLAPDDPSRLKKPGFVVWSPQCKIPDVDPFEDSIVGLLRPVKPIVCSDRPPLTYVEELDEEDGTVGTRYVLSVNESVKKKYVWKNNFVLICSYCSIVRGTMPPSSFQFRDFSDYYRTKLCKDFDKEVILQPEDEFIIVQCHIARKGITASKNVYSNIHGVFPIKPSVSSKIIKRKTPEDDARPNVLMVGFDSMSRLSLLRTMPQTISNLRRVGYIELQGYNKIGANPFSYLIAALAGYTTSQFQKKCGMNVYDDDCPFVWKEYHNHGYLSVFAEDEPQQNTFHFHNQSTDYYFRTYMLAASQKLQIKKRHNLIVCMGPLTTTDHVLMYAERFLKTFRNTFYFALFWLNNFSRGDLNEPSAMDVRIHQFFNELNVIGTYKNTIVIFFSDYGFRSERIRGTYVGWLEDKMPFIHIFLPHSFRKKYPNAYKNLLMNRNKLTSPLDLYATLRFILNTPLNLTSKPDHLSRSCPRCKSLFEDVGNRSCKGSGIFRRWCACTEYKKIPEDDPTMLNAAKFVLYEIQNKLRKATQSNLCAHLTVNRVTKAQVKIDIHEKNPTENDYLITFETLPGEALFETSVRIKISDTFHKMSILGAINRVNTYAHQSSCVDDAALKIYCFCVYS